MLVKLNIRLIAACSLILMAPTMAATGNETWARKYWVKMMAGHHSTPVQPAGPQQTRTGIHCPNRSELIAALNNGVYPPPKNPSTAKDHLYRWNNRRECR